MATIAAVLSFAAPAHASFELVGTFGEGAAAPKGEEFKAQEGIGDSLGGVGVAVYDSTGDVYVADKGNNRVLRFSAHGRFLEAWGWGVSDGKSEFERCGPEGETGSKGEILRCKGRNERGEGLRGEGAGELQAPSAIAVDQATGEVFVKAERTIGVVQVFSADGQLLRSFGERGNALPEQIREPGDIVIAESGNLYVVDNKEGATGAGVQRVMLFERESSGGYRYARDVVHASLWLVEQIAVDTQGDVYMKADGGSVGEGVYKFATSNPSAPAWAKPAPNGYGVAVDQTSGKVFYYDPSGNELRVLDAATGAEVEAFPAAKEQIAMANLAFDPALNWESARPAGTLYGTVPYNGVPGEASFVEVFAQPPVFPPRVDGESVRGVGSTSVALQASISPQGYETTYRFQYGSEDCATGACVEAPVGGGVLGSGQSDLVAGLSVSGLQPTTTYHYRVLASNQYGTVAGPDQTFTTYPSLPAGLPDGRVYELVSPAFKDGGEVFPARAEVASAACDECVPGQNSVSSAMQASPGGDSVVYEGFPFAPSGVTVGYNEYLSTRTASGWQTHDLSPALESPEGGSYRAFSSNLSEGVLWQSGTDGALSGEAPAGYADLYVQSTNESGALRPLMTSAPPDVPLGGAFSLRFASASADFSHVVFVANDALTPDARYAGASTGNVYEWTGGQLSLVNVLPGGAGSDPNAVLGAGEAMRTNEGGPDVSHAVSADGSRVFWSDAASGQVYVREDGETTVQIPDPGRFLTASADGSSVLLNDGRLYNIEGGSTVDLTAGHGGFQGVVGASEDLSRIYFVDTAVLTGTETNGQGAGALSGADNLYEYDASGSGSTVFVATLAPGDDTSDVGLTGDWTASPSDRTAQATPDGRFLVFVSTVSLTGYDNTEANGRPVFEVFEYGAEGGALTCVSCGLQGVHPTGESSLGLVRPLGKNGIYPQPRDVLADGRVFFNSRSSLSPYDINGNVQDVYEHEPSGVGSCERQAGCVFLISRGTGSEDSEFVDASASGSDVFFTTRDRLVPADQDDLEDLYDARVNGGFAELTAPACSGTGCQGVPGAPPIFATPSSVTFAGVGNFEQSSASTSGGSKPKHKTSRCVNKKLVHGRCAKKAAKRARKAGRGRGKRGR